MSEAPTATTLATLATARAGGTQRRLAVAVSLAFAFVTLALLPIADRPMPPMPGFVPVYQSALIVIYGLTTYLFLAQYRRIRSLSLLVLGVGSLFVMLVVLLQLLSFPNVLTQGRLVGDGPDTTTWLWTFWHLGPPLFALPYAIMEGDRRPPRAPPGRTWRIGLLAVAGTVAAAALTGVAATRFVHLLPKCVDGDDYRLLTTSGIGPGVVALTVLALATLCWKTRLRTVLQLWLAVSLLLLVFDNMVTLPGAARGTVGWFAGRMEALVAGFILLGVYLREVDFLYAQASAAAEEREARRAELQRARDNLALALEAAEMGDWEFDLHAGTSRRSTRHDAILGHREPVAAWDVETFLGHVVPEDRDAVRAAFDAARVSGHLEFDCRILRSDDGATRSVAVRGKVYRDGHGRPRSMAGVVMDTTRQREAEERLNQAHRMEAIGQLTGGVAHDFNNLLTIIVGNLDMIVRKPDNPQRVERMATSAMAAARRGAEVTEKLLSFSRRQVLRAETVNPNRLIKDFQSLLHRAVGETVEVRFDLDASLDPVRLDPGQFENAVLNLAVNARDAMPGGGVLTVKTCNAHLDAHEIVDRPDLRPGSYVLIAVTDTGRGMDAATRGRAFEPFFTTKDVGKGTGLGLSQVYGFVRQAGGHAQIKSEVDGGTSVELYLPRSAEKEVGVRPDHALPLRRAAAGEVVLVVEDEPAVLEMAVESLSELGYRTLTATRASEALARLGGPDRIDILFSDVVMPGGMNGVQLSVEARRLRPGLRVLLTSGYTGTALDEHAVPADMPLLSKPYQRDELANKLRVVMG